MLKIIADDLGLHKSVNDGIIFLLKQKKIDGASLMANGKAFEHAVSLVSGLGDNSIGAHLVLVEEESLSGIKLCSNHKEFFIKYLFGFIDINRIEREMREQIDKILQVGIKLDFLNSHQHLHLLPGIMNKTIKLAKEYGIPYIRIVHEPVFSGGDNMFRRLEVIYLNLLSRLASKKIKKAGLKCNDIFVGFINAGHVDDMTLKKAKLISEKYPNSVAELGCHPGYENDDLRDKFKHWGSYSWAKELEVLKSIS